MTAFDHRIIGQPHSCGRFHCPTEFTFHSFPLHSFHSSCSSPHAEDDFLRELIELLVVQFGAGESIPVEGHRLQLLGLRRRGLLGVETQVLEQALDLRIGV